MTKKEEIDKAKESDRHLLSARVSHLYGVPESEIQKMVSDTLSKYFHVRREVLSEDGSSRIDVIAVHKSDNNGNFPIGIEIKAVGKKRGVEIGDWINQAYKYSQLPFRGFGKVAVFLFPQISGLYLEEGSEVSRHNLTGRQIWEGGHHNVATMLSSFDLGELQFYKTWKGKWRLRLVYAAKRIWEQHNDIFQPNNLTNLKKAA